MGQHTQTSEKMRAKRKLVINKTKKRFMRVVMSFFIWLKDILRPNSHALFKKQIIEQEYKKESGFNFVVKDINGKILRDIKEGGAIGWIKKATKICIVILISFLARNLPKLASRCVYSLILGELGIPGYFIGILNSCDFNFLLSLYFLIKYHDEHTFYVNMMVLIPQMFLVQKHLAFALPIIILFIFRHARSLSNHRVFIFFINVTITTIQILWVIRRWRMPLEMEKTDHFIMDRAKIILSTAYGDHIDGQFDIIKVHEEIETPEIKSEEMAATPLTFGLQTTAKKKEQDFSTATDETGIDASKKEVSAEKKPEKKFRREMDSFLKHNDLIRLLHIPTSRYMASTEHKLDNKFYKVNFAGQSETSFHLWRVILHKNTEYLQAGRFFKIKNAHTGLTLGIRGDGTLNCSHEGRKTRQYFVVKTCENHRYYKNVQENPAHLQMAQSETEYLENLMVYDFGFGLDIFHLFLYLILLLFFLINVILHVRLGYRILIDQKIWAITIFTGLTLIIINQRYFKSGLILILLRITANGILQ